MRGEDGGDLLLGSADLDNLTLARVGDRNSLDAHQELFEVVRARAAAARWAICSPSRCAASTRNTQSPNLTWYGVYEGSPDAFNQLDAATLKPVSDLLTPIRVVPPTSPPQPAPSIAIAAPQAEIARQRPRRSLALAAAVALWLLFALALARLYFDLSPACGLAAALRPAPAGRHGAAGALSRLQRNRPRLDRVLAAAGRRHIRHQQAARDRAIPRCVGSHALPGRAPRRDLRRRAGAGPGAEQLGARPRHPRRKGQVRPHPQNRFRLRHPARAGRAGGYVAPTEQDARNEQEFMLARRFTDLGWFFSSEVADSDGRRVSNMQQWALEWIRGLFFEMKKRQIRSGAFREEARRPSSSIWSAAS